MSKRRRAEPEPQPGWATWAGEPRVWGLGFAGFVVVGLGIAFLWPGGAERPAAAAAEQQPLPPGRFVLEDASWEVATAEPVAAHESDGEVAGAELLDLDRAERQRLAEEARDRWQSLDIAVRR